MSLPNEEFPSVYAELEHQIKQVTNEDNNAPHLRPGETPPRERKPLSNYESAMRAHAAGCEAGR
jgi:hypothetical protein